MMKVEASILIKILSLYFNAPSSEEEYFFINRSTRYTGQKIYIRSFQNLVNYILTYFRMSEYPKINF